jgi:LAS superfamily LD-carboxypeptidase LdcB
MLASVLALVLVLSSLVPTEPPPSLTESVSGRPLTSLALWLQREPAAITRDEASRPASVFGLPAADARMVLIAVDRQRPLPEGYSPPDLVWVGGRQVRSLMRADLLAMMETASSERVELAPISTYRSPDQQELAFESAVWGAMARGASDRTEAENRSSRYVAPPGRSQHQLGTAVDFSTWEINYSIQPAFAETAAGAWLAQHGWEFGFVLPYPSNGEERTGYAYEPWHWRWIGRELAAVMQRDGYVGHPSLIADDYLRAAEEILTAEGLP